jgi:hypothetical protein
LYMPLAAFRTFVRAIDSFLKPEKAFRRGFQKGFSDFSVNSHLMTHNFFLKI